MAALIVLCGVLGGMAAALQGPLTSMISGRLGVLEAVFIIHFGGALAVLPLMLGFGGGAIRQWRSVPWYALCAGALGLVVLWSITFCIPKVGVTATITAFVAGQLVLGMVLDHSGLFIPEARPVDLARLGGLALVFLGTWLFLKPAG